MTNGLMLSRFSVISSQSRPNMPGALGDAACKLVPRTAKVDGLSADFTLEFPACSITVLKLKAQ